MGGGCNHRFALYDGVLIKDNHIAAAGGIGPAVKRVRERIPHTLKIEVEEKSGAELEEALAAGADAVMLDNMSLADMAHAVAQVIKEHLLSLLRRLSDIFKSATENMLYTVRIAA